MSCVASGIASGITSGIMTDTEFTLTPKLKCEISGIDSSINQTSELYALCKKSIESVCNFNDNVNRIIQSVIPELEKVIKKVKPIKNANLLVKLLILPTKKFTTQYEYDSFMTTLNVFNTISDINDANHLSEVFTNIYDNLLQNLHTM